MGVVDDIELDEGGGPGRVHCMRELGLITNHAHEGLLALDNVAFDHLGDSRVH
jgi:hypothetical protein